MPRVREVAELCFYRVGSTNCSAHWMSPAAWNCEGLMKCGTGHGPDRMARPKARFCNHTQTRERVMARPRWPWNPTADWLASPLATRRSHLRTSHLIRPQFKVVAVMSM